MLKITSVQTQRLATSEGAKIIGLARVVIENCFVIDDIRIIAGSGDKGLFIGFPSRKQQNMEWKDVCHPLDSKTRKYFEDTILEKFNEKGVDESDITNN